MDEFGQKMVGCETTLSVIFNSVSSAIGIHVMLIILERALWKTEIKYPDANRITFSEDGISADGLFDLGSDKADRILNEFILSVIETLSRLVGVHVAQKITEELVKDMDKKELI